MTRLQMAKSRFQSWLLKVHPILMIHLSTMKAKVEFRMKWQWLPWTNHMCTCTRLWLSWLFWHSWRQLSKRTKLINRSNRSTWSTTFWLDRFNLDSFCACLLQWKTNMSTTSSISLPTFLFCWSSLLHQLVSTSCSIQKLEGQCSLWNM